jgi:uncharacterized protein (DUF2062 family)
MFRKMKGMIGDFLVKGLSPSEIAFGISLGNFVGILPFLGLHTAIALGLAWLLRLNMGVVFLGTQISNPLSFPFILFISAQIGSVVLHGTFLDLSFSGDVMLLIKQYLYPTLIGSILLGLAVGIVTYPITLRFARRFRS